MPDPSAPDPEVIARAWHMSAKERRSTREIATALGVAPSTASVYVRKGRDAEQWIDLLDRAEQRTDASARLGEYLRRTLALLDDDEISVADSVNVIALALKIEARLAAMLGLDAPSRVAIGNDKGPGATPDMGVIDACRRYAERNRRDDEELRAGRPGVIEQRGSAT